MATTIQFANGDTFQYDGTTDINRYDGIARFIKRETGNKSFDLFKIDGTELHRNIDIQLNDTIVCIFKPEVCRTCKKLAETDETNDECKECMEYKLYSYFPNYGLNWWRSYFDNDYTGEIDEPIDFRAKITKGAGQYQSTLEWFYCDDGALKIHKKRFNPNSVFWQEFEMTYCYCYDDEDYY